MTDVTVEGVVDHADGTVDVPETEQVPEAAHPGTTRTWLPGIEALRGVAALTVVIHHSWALSSDALPHVPDRIPVYQVVEGLGLWGVMLFFMLSGYLLSDTFWRSEPADLRVYGIRRFFRIAPAYYVNVAILFLFFVPTGLLFSSVGVRQVFANLTFTQHLFPQTTSSLFVNGALWTLTIEMMLYLLLPVMALLVKKAPWLATTGLILIGLAWQAWVAYHGHGIRDFYFGEYHPGGVAPKVRSTFIAGQFPGLVGIFALGIMARWLVVHGKLDGLYRRLPSRLGVSSFLVLTLPSIGLLYWCETATNFHHGLLFTVYDFALMLVLLPCLLLAARPAQFTASPLRSVGTWLGERSYSIYLWHFPIILAIYERGAFGAPPTAGYWWRLPAILLTTLVFATASYRLVERPGMEYGRVLADRIRNGRPTPLPVKEPAP